MSVEVKRKGQESSEGLLRRFQDNVKRSRFLINAKRLRFRSKKKSKRQIKQDALARKKGRAKRAYLIKTGKIVEPVRGGFSRRK